MLRISSEYRKRIADFLSDYIDITDNKVGYDDDRVIMQGMGILIEEGVFIIKELQINALRENSVLIPVDFINKCVAMRNAP